MQMFELLIPDEIYDDLLQASQHEELTLNQFCRKAIMEYTYKKGETDEQ